MGDKGKLEWTTEEEAGDVCAVAPIGRDGVVTLGADDNQVRLSYGSLTVELEAEDVEQAKWLGEALLPAFEAFVERVNADLRKAWAERKGRHG